MSKDSIHDYYPDYLALKKQRKAAGVLAAAPGSLSPAETAQLEAALVLINRGDIQMAMRVINKAPHDTALAADLTAYIRRNSENDQTLPPKGAL